MRPTDEVLRRKFALGSEYLADRGAGQTPGLRFALESSDPDRVRIDVYDGTGERMAIITGQAGGEWHVSMMTPGAAVHAATVSLPKVTGRLTRFLIDQDLERRF